MNVDSGTMKPQFCGSIPAMVLVFLLPCLGPGLWAQNSALFDFDGAPLHSSLPLDITVEGLTAHFWATGQGYSVQRTDVLGFTPVGFAGNCIYPNSVFAADLHVSFSEALTSLSILYAPEEYACDSSATMRVTAYLNGAFVGTSTMAAEPGTWPTATLAYNSSAVFNDVVVHYDSAPPTGGDWGPIFMADNLAVTTAAMPVAT